MQTANRFHQSFGPLTGTRVLEISRARPARIAGMLLADLGAEVVRALDPLAPAEPVTPHAVCWDRGKRLMPLDSESTWSAVAGADVVLADDAPSSVDEHGRAANALQRAFPSLIHVWMPPYGESGEWRDLPEDPLLLAALGSLAVYYPADDDSPIAPAVAGLTHLHGALGALMAVAGLVTRQRSGPAPQAVVTGLHAAAMLMGTAFAEINDGPAFAPTRSLRGTPNWRLYRCGDGRWVYLAALTQEIFFRALDALGRLDVMALPEVAGDFRAVLDLNRGRTAVAAQLEPVFASDTSAHWVARLREARVPCITVQAREDWLDSPLVRDNDGRIDLAHPVLGLVTMPNVPITFSGTPVTVRGFARAQQQSGESSVWDPAAGRSRSKPAAPQSAPPTLPLTGVTVVETASFLAGPLISTLLADLGADVLKVEPVGGESYRNFALSFLAVNQRKRGLQLDLKTQDGIVALNTALASADIFVENLRPRALAALELAEDSTTPRHPHLVHCSVSAFGRAEAYADYPGFDPILQAINGMAMAQGGDDEPTFSNAPINDAATGVLGALGAVAALYHRGVSGRGQQVWLSLAASSSFIQSPEYTTWPGSPEPQRGGALFRGPHPAHSYHRCRDGWTAVAAVTERQQAGLRSALGIEDLSAVAPVLLSLEVAQATELLCAHGVPACRVVPRQRPLLDRFLLDNDFSHLVELPPDGVARVVDHFSRWPLAPAPRPGQFLSLADRSGRT